MNKIAIFDVPVSLFERNELVDQIVHPESPKNKTVIGHVNIKALNIAYKNSRYKRFLQNCDWVYADGYGPLLGAKILDQQANSSHRHTCPDFIDQLLEQLEKYNKKIYFLAGKCEVIERLKIKLKRRHPALNFKAHHGFFEKKGAENEAVIAKINDFKPDLLFVGLGMPLQEFWIADNLHRIDAKVFLPEGACLDFYTNTVARGPAILTDNGFEWLSRLITEPGRLWRRYLIGNPKFFWRIIKDKL